MNQILPKHMSVRTIFQLFLVLILFYDLFFIEKYFVKDSKKNSINVNKKLKSFLNTDQNLIKDIEYNSTK